MTNNFDLLAVLPSLLPGAIAWAQAQSLEAARRGNALDGSTTRIAQLVGVQQPELVRIHVVESLPLPEETNLRAAALRTGLLGPAMVGLTLGHSILVCRGHLTLRLLSHELRHVHQYEAHGSIAQFLPVYLRQIVEFGYENAPFEVDARSHERHGA